VICAADDGNLIVTLKRFGRNHLSMVQAATADPAPWLPEYPRAGLPFCGRPGARRRAYLDLLA